MAPLHSHREGDRGSAYVGEGDILRALQGAQGNGSEAAEAEYAALVGIIERAVLKGGAIAEGKERCHH